MMLTRIVEAATVVRQAATVRLLPSSRGRATGRHLLLVSHDFPPAAVTAAQLPAFLARHAVQRAWRVTVVCGALPFAPSARGLSAFDQLPESVRIVRAPGHYDAEEYYPRFPYRLSSRIDGGYAQQVGMTYAAFRALRADPPSHIFATGPTFNNFAAGRTLARRFRVPLTLQYRDEWTVMPPSFVDRSEASRSLEERCLDEAGLITFVTEGKATVYREAFPRLSAKQVMVIPNGWDPELLPQRNLQSGHLAHLRSRLILTFAGRVTAETPIQPLLTLLVQILEEDLALRERLVLCVVGDQRTDTIEALEALNRRRPGTVEIMPPVPQVAAQEILHESSVLLLLNNTRYAGVLPLKTFDYMVSEKPILVFGRTGEAEAIVQRTGAGLSVAETDPEGLRTALHALAGTDAGWSGPARQAWNEAHNRATLNDALLTAMEQLSSSG